MTLNLEETLAELRLATAVRRHRDRLQEIIDQLTEELRGLDLEILATLSRIEEERPGDDYAWMTKERAYMLMPAGSDEELV